jgi:putative modified peptide
MDAMSQRNVERVIGRLVTDETFRSRFARDPAAAIGEIVDMGVDLTAIEVQALAVLDTDLVSRIAEALDPRLQKIDCCGGRS